MKEFSLSTRIVFGENALNKLKEISKRKVFFVTDDFMVKSGTIDRISSYLDQCEVTIFSDVIPDPSIEVVVSGVKKLYESNSTILIAVGGGSAIDTAKAIREMIRKMDDLSFELDECFAIPTTSGTGSEVTSFSVISNYAEEIKYTLNSSSLQPAVAILDSSLVATVPSKVTADSGMDVLTHALEAYVSKDANCFTDAFSEKTIRLVTNSLYAAFKDGSNIKARDDMHNASCMAGLAFNSAGLGLCHGLAHAVGAKFKIAHGRANAMILPHVIRFNASENNYDNISAHKYHEIAKQLGLISSTPMIGVNQLIKQISNMNKKLNIPATLNEANIGVDTISKHENEIIDLALNDSITATNPRVPTSEDIKDLLKIISR